MGNKHPETEAKQKIFPIAKPVLPLKLIQVRSMSKTHYDTSKLEYRNTNFTKIESIKNKWEALQEIETDKIAKPFLIQLTKHTKFFQLEYLLEVSFEQYDYSFESFMQFQQKTNPLISEIKLLTMFADCFEGLYMLWQEGIQHNNIHPNSIFFLNNSRWVIDKPSFGLPTLFEKVSKGQTDLTFFLAPEFFSGEIFNCFTSDLYSLGITIIHCISPFEEINRKRILREDEIAAKLRFIKHYYSTTFVFILKGLTKENPKNRLSFSDIFEIIKELKDL